MKKRDKKEDPHVEKGCVLVVVVGENNYGRFGERFFPSSREFAYCVRAVYASRPAYTQKKRVVLQRALHAEKRGYGNYAPPFDIMEIFGTRKSNLLRAFVHSNVANATSATSQTGHVKNYKR